MKPYAECVALGTLGSSLGSPRMQSISAGGSRLIPSLVSKDGLGAVETQQSRKKTTVLQVNSHPGPPLSRKVDYLESFNNHQIMQVQTKSPESGIDLTAVGECVFPYVYGVSPHQRLVQIACRKLFSLLCLRSQPQLLGHHCKAHGCRMLGDQGHIRWPGRAYKLGAETAIPVQLVQIEISSVLSVLMWFSLGPEPGVCAQQSLCPPSLQVI